MRKVLRLAALCTEALKRLARDEIGMEAAQALTLTGDHDRQREALQRCGNQAHSIRRMLTDDKIGTGSSLFLFVGLDAYRGAGGTITADLFAGEGDGHADDPALVEALAMAKLDALAASYRADGWQDVRTSPERAHDYYGFTHVHPGGSRKPSSEERCELDRIAEAIAARLAALGETNAWGDVELDASRRDQRRIEHGLLAFTAGQKAESAMILFVGHGGEIEAKAIRTKRASKATATATGAAGEKPDYSGPMIETLSRIKTLAVQEVVAGNPALALDILLDCLAGQIVHADPAYHSPLSLRLEGFNAAVPDDMMAGYDIAGVAKLSAADFAALPERDRLAFIQAMDAEAKGRLLALLVASQIDGGQASGTRRDTRHRRFERIAAASGVDIAAKWQAPIAFFERLKKPVILKIMAEELGQAAADNCAKMKKGDLVLAAAERLAGRGWLPQPLRIEEPEPEADTGASDELPDFEQDEAA